MIIIRPVKKDILYHDLLNNSNMDIIEYIVIKILNLLYDKQQEIIHAFDNPDKGIFLKVINIKTEFYSKFPF